MPESDLICCLCQVQTVQQLGLGIKPNWPVMVSRMTLFPLVEQIFTLSLCDPPSLCPLCSSVFTIPESTLFLCVPIVFVSLLFLCHHCCCVPTLPVYTFVLVSPLFLCPTVTVFLCFCFPVIALSPQFLYSHLSFVYSMFLYHRCSYALCSFVLIVPIIIPTLPEHCSSGKGHLLSL